MYTCKWNNNVLNASVYASYVYLILNNNWFILIYAKLSEAEGNQCLIVYNSPISLYLISGTKIGPQIQIPLKIPLQKHPR